MSCYSNKGLQQNHYCVKFRLNKSRCGDVADVHNCTCACLVFLLNWNENVIDNPMWSTAGGQRRPCALHSSTHPWWQESLSNLINHTGSQSFNLGGLAKQLLRSSRDLQEADGKSRHTTVKTETSWVAEVQTAFLCLSLRIPRCNLVCNAHRMCCFGVHPREYRRWSFLPVSDKWTLNLETLVTHFTCSCVSAPRWLHKKTTGRGTAHRWNQIISTFREQDVFMQGKLFAK